MSGERETVVVVWLKRDLRLSDHAAFDAAVATKMPVLPLFVVETEYWNQPFASRRHWCFIRDCLEDLDKRCCALGQSLVVWQAPDAVSALSAIAEKVSIAHIFSHEETGNDWTYQRDCRLHDWCRQISVPFTEFPNNGVVRRLKSRDHWSGVRNARLSKALFPVPESLCPVSTIQSHILPSKQSSIFGSALHGVVQQGGRWHAENTLKRFLQVHAKDYLYHLSAPGASEITCSRLSTFLAYGVFSVREVIHALDDRVLALSPSDKKSWSRSLSAFRSRLSWRDHFIQKIEDQPSIEYRCMHPGFENMRQRPGNQLWLQAWESGHTGYPFIDACMRNLNYHGWITFRMRAMLVSFASYHLWFDWRDTGYHLARTFTDYEPGIHYSQLQMQSGVTGINALRIYNPIKQSQEHDPDGVFIKKWVPELAACPKEYIHEPWTIPPLLQNECGIALGQDYPMPVVDHQVAIAHARERIAVVRKQLDFKRQAGQVYQKLGSRRPPPSRRKKKKDNGSQSQLQMDLDA